MIPVNFQTNDEFQLEHLKIILKDKFKYTDNKNSNFICHIDFINHELKINFSNIKHGNFSLPINLDDLFNFFDEANSLINISIFDLDYYPFKSQLLNINHSIMLTDIHNNILLNLSLYKMGIEKVELYKIIWPKDKEIILNKLDTHLTNLKNIVQDSFGIFPKIITKNKKIYIN